MSYTKKIFFENPIHPGLSLNDVLGALEMTQKELAKRTDLTEKHITGIIRGKNGISPDVALRFERALGTPASFWNNLQKSYDEDTVRIQEQETLKNETSEVSKFTCYRDLFSLGLVEDTRKKGEKLISLLRFFSVTSLKNIPNVQEVAYRKYEGKTFSKENFLAWVRVGDIIGNQIEVEDFNRSKIKDIIPQLKEMTKCKDIDIKKIERLLAGIGIRFAFVKGFKNNPIAGVCRKYRGKPLIQISDRWQKHDIFWFTLFHELGHVALHLNKNNSIFIDMDDGGKVSTMEQEADSFAQNALLDSHIYQKEISKDNISIDKISSSCGVSKSIVAGRLAHDFKEQRRHDIGGLVNSLRLKLVVTNTQLG